MKSYPYILVITGLTGIITSLLLTLDKIALLKNPQAILPCNINPLVSCGPIINTWQASAFGLPNPIFGIVGFSLVLMTGVILIFGTQLSNKFWKLFTLGTIFPLLFIHWLIYQSVHVIGNLCLYCMITWIAVWPLFFYSLINLLKIKGENFITKNHLTIFVSWYLLITLLILSHFRDFFFS